MCSPGNCWQDHSTIAVETETFPIGLGFGPQIAYERGMVINGLILAATIAGVSAAKPQVEIISVDTDTAFAGKLGYLVHQKLVVKVDGKNSKVEVAAYHDRFAKNAKFAPGDHLALNLSKAEIEKLNRGNLKIRLDQIRKS